VCVCVCVCICICVLLFLLRASDNMANTRVHYFSLLLFLFFLTLAVSPAKPTKPVSPDSRSRFQLYDKMEHVSSVCTLANRWRNSISMCSGGAELTASSE